MDYTMDLVRGARYDTGTDRIMARALRAIPAAISSRYQRTEKLHTVRDGFRHLWYILRA